MSKVVIVAHRERDDARALAVTVARWLRARGHEAWMPVDEAEGADLEELASDAPPASCSCSRESLARDSE